MKLTDLVDHVANEAGIQKSAAKKGEGVNLPGFGKFKVKDSQARQGRNLNTGEIIEIPASRKLGFSPAKQVKDALAG
jgi:DNA-binding protein HU-beta